MPGPPGVAVAPQPPGDEDHRERLVDRRRVHGLGRRHRAVRIGHRPRAVPGDAVVAVARQLAADPPDRVARRQRHGRHVEHRQREPAPPGRPREHRRPRRRTRRRTRRGRSRRTGCRAGRPWRRTSSRRSTTAARRPGRRRARRRSSRRPSPAACRAPAVARRADARDHEPQPHHQPERLQGQAEDVDLGLHAAYTVPAPLQVVHGVHDVAVDAHLEVEVRRRSSGRCSRRSR